MALFRPGAIAFGLQGLSLDRMALVKALGWNKEVPC
jgi:hypothetical protein